MILVLFIFLIKDIENKQAVACIYTNRVRGCATHTTCGRHKL